MDKTILLDSVVIDPTSFSKTLSLIEEIGKKTVQSTHRRLEELVEQLHEALDPERKRALRHLQYWQ